MLFVAITSCGHGQPSTTDIKKDLEAKITAGASVEEIESLFESAPKPVDSDLPAWVARRLATEGRVDVMEELKKQLDFVAPDTSGENTLFYAVRAGMVEAAAFILKQKGIDFRVKNGKGQTALEVTPETASSQLTEWIEELHGEAVKLTALERAIASGDAVAIEKALPALERAEHVDGLACAEVIDYLTRKADDALTRRLGLTAAPVFGLFPIEDYAKDTAVRRLIESQGRSGAIGLVRYWEQFLEGMYYLGDSATDSACLGFALLVLFTEIDERGAAARADSLVADMEQGRDKFPPEEALSMSREIEEMESDRSKMLRILSGAMDSGPRTVLYLLRQGFPCDVSYSQYVYSDGAEIIADLAASGHDCRLLVKMVEEGYYANNFDLVSNLLEKKVDSEKYYSLYKAILEKGLDIMEVRSNYQGDRNTLNPPATAPKDAYNDTVREYDGISLLYLAVKFGDGRLGKLLYDAGADPFTMVEEYDVEYIYPKEDPEVEYYRVPILITRTTPIELATVEGVLDSTFAYLREKAR